MVFGWDCKLVHLTDMNQMELGLVLESTVIVMEIWKGLLWEPESDSKLCCNTTESAFENKTLPKIELYKQLNRVRLEPMESLYAYIRALVTPSMLVAALAICSV